ncbi:MAG TPA: hypothetical protein PLQ35_03850 [bacterium]|nr:hypothetical protein [bacterium]HQL61405.1 hypothetical protein [bacterium]
MVRRDSIKFMQRVVYGCAILLVAVLSVQADKYPVKVGVFKQEVTVVYGLQDGLPSVEATAVAIAPDGPVYAGTKKGLAVLKEGRWNKVYSGSIFASVTDGDRILAAAGKDLVSVGPDGVEPLLPLPPGEVLRMASKNGIVYLAMTSGLYRLENKALAADDTLNGMLGENKHVYSVAADDKGTLAVGAESGLFRKEAGQNWMALYPFDKTGRRWAPRSVRGVAFDSRGRLWFASPQGVGCYDGAWTLYEGKDGLPFNDFTTLCAGEDGVVWFGTQMGAIRFDGQNWAYRQGRAWLPDDRVVNMAVNANGDAWFATPGGVGVIERRPMTLAEKAEFYEDEMEKYIRRTEYGYVSEVGLGKPGDKSEIHYSDSDNDGLWTGMYGAGECFAYAATKDPKAKDRAKRAFEALRFLSIAPVGGEVQQQPGYVARTVVPTTEPNPNAHYTLEGQQRTRATRDSLWKVYTPRYPLTADKKYWYKTDVSSDELDGHYFFYPAYYDLVADTPEEKERVREVVRNITDHLVRNDFCMIDFDGTPTRWAVYSPAKLNHDHNWYAERGLKSLSILSYLAVAEHITGDPKYGEAANRLRQEHAFDTNIMIPKVHNGIGSGNQSDDEMFFMCFYNLVKYTKDDTLRERVTFAFYEHWVREFPEVNPFFNFAYAASGMGTQYTDPWGTHDLSPWDGWLTDSIDTLEGFPLDRCNWARHNSHRLDIVFLEPQAAFESFARNRKNRRRGYLVNGKVLPVQERHFNHWNTDPWELDYGGNGQGLAGGTVFLLPYYMGLYHGFIE